MLGQGEIGVLSTADLEDWRRMEAELAGIDQCPEKWSQDDLRKKHYDRLILMACFYDNYGLDRTKVFEFNPITGSITEPAWEIAMGETE